MTVTTEFALRGSQCKTRTLLSESATLPPTTWGRADKRALTARRIVLCAQELTLEHGLDGFTLEELAERAGVSRRTLFDDFDGKLAATLGGGPRLTQEDVDTFLAGGPSGSFTDDVAALAVGVFRASTELPLQRDDWAIARRCFEANPKLIIAAQQQFEGFAEGIPSCSRSDPASPARRRPTSAADRRARRDVRGVAAAIRRRRGRTRDRRHLPGQPANGAAAAALNQPTPFNSNHFQGPAMASLLYRLGRTAYRRWPIFLAVWAIILVGFGATAIGVSQADGRQVQRAGHPVAAGPDDGAAALPGHRGRAGSGERDGRRRRAGRPHAARDAIQESGVDQLVTNLKKLPQMPTDAKAQPVSPIVAAQAQTKHALAAAGKTSAEQAAAKQNAQDCRR